MAAHRLSPSGPFLSAPEVATLADLAAFRDTSSDLVWVESLACYWHLNALSTLPPDGITVIAAATTGNWERLVETTAPDWLTEAAWVIDPALGDDENAGDAAAPLATFAELNRRLSAGELRQNTVATVVAGAVCDSCVLDLDLGDFTFTIEGEPTLVATDTIASYVDRNHATPTSARLTATGIADWTPYEGMRVRVTDGAQAGAICWLGRPDPQGAGLDVARVNRFGTAPFGVAVDPPDGSTFVIETLPYLGDLVEIRGRSNGDDYTIDKLFINSLRMGPGVTVGIKEVGTAFDGCNIDSGAAFLASVVNLRKLGPCWIRRSIFKGEAANYRVLTDVSVSNALTRTTIAPTSISVGGVLSNLLGDGAGVDIGTTPPNGITLFSHQTFDAAIAISMSNFCALYTSQGMSGNGNGIGLQIGGTTANYSDDCQFGWSTPANKPNLIGTTADIRIEGATDQLLSWADTPFNGDEQHGVGTLMAGTATITARNASVRGVTVSKATPAGNPQGQLSVPTASRTTTQFVVNAIDAAGALLASDTSTFDWHIPGTFRGIRLYERNSQE